MDIFWNHTFSVDRICNKTTKNVSNFKTFLILHKLGNNAEKYSLLDDKIDI